MNLHLRITRREVGNSLVSIYVSLMLSLSILMFSLIYSCGPYDDPFVDIYGEVIDMQSQKPIERAWVSRSDTLPDTRRIYTDSSGSFYFSAIMTGTETIFTGKEGYITAKQDITYHGQRIINLVFELEKEE